MSSSTGRLNDYCVGKGSDPGMKDMAPVMSKESAQHLLSPDVCMIELRPIGLAAFSDAG